VNAPRIIPDMSPSSVRPDPRGDQDYRALAWLNAVMRLWRKLEK